MTDAPTNNVSWWKSPASGQGNCVEVAFAEPSVVLVRSSREPNGPLLRLTRAEWDAFVAGVRAGAFDTAD